MVNRAKKMLDTRLPKDENLSSPNRQKENLADDSSCTRLYTVFLDCLICARHVNLKIKELPGRNDLDRHNLLGLR